MPSNAAEWPFREKWRTLRKPYAAVVRERCNDMNEVAPVRRDPIGDKYFRPLEIAARLSDISFYGAAVLSFAALLVEKTGHPALYEFVQIAFVLAVLFVFVSG